MEPKTLLKSGRPVQVVTARLSDKLGDNRADLRRTLADACERKPALPYGDGGARAHVALPSGRRGRRDKAQAYRPASCRMSAW